MVRVWAIGLLVSSVSVACTPTEFGCLDSTQCVDAGVEGVCQPTGNCSFPDDACPSGQRYGTHSNDGLAGECVPAEGESAATGSGSASASGSSGSQSGSESAGPVTTLGTSTGEATTGMPVTAGQTSSTTAVDPPTSGETGIAVSGPETKGVTTGPPAEGCALYCELKADCGEAGIGCTNACESGLDYAKSFGPGCEDALEELMDCRSGLSCGDLSVHLSQPLDEDNACASEVIAVGAACPTMGCASLCDAAASCMIDAVGNPCAEGCSGSTVATLLDGGGDECIEANEGFYSCLSALDCSTLTEVFVNGNLVACEQHIPELIESCP